MIRKRILIISKTHRKVIKSIVFLNTKKSEYPKIIFNNKVELLTNSKEISNNLNSFFVGSISPITSSNIEKPESIFIII